jgi:hypothetical protein
LPDNIPTGLALGFAAAIQEFEEAHRRGLLVFFVAGAGESRIAENVRPELLRILYFALTVSGAVDSLLSRVVATAL